MCHLTELHASPYKVFAFIYKLVKGPCVAWFFHKLIEYTFYLINNNLSNNCYNKKRKKIGIIIIKYKMITSNKIIIL